MSPFDQDVDIVFYDLPDGSQIPLQVISSTQFHNQKCIICDQCRQPLAFNKNGSLENITRHRGSEKCITRRKRDERTAAIRLEEEKLTRNGDDESVGADQQLSITPSNEEDARSHDTEIDNQLMSQCVGVVVIWSGQVTSSYPFHIHEEQDLDWIPIAFRKDNNQLVLRSVDCVAFRVSNKESISDARTCPQCAAIPNSSQFRQIKGRSIVSSPHTPWKYLTYTQITSAAKRLREENNSLRLENLNLRRRVLNLQIKVTDYQRFTVLLASRNITRLRHLVCSLLRHGNSIKSIVVQLERATGDVAIGRSNDERWTDRELDLALLARSLGGPKLLYALQKAQGYPSDRTLRRQRPLISLQGSLKCPTASDIGRNLTDFLSHITFGSGPGPMQIMIDDVALDERLRYNGDRNSVIGVCREHSNEYNLQVNDWPSLERLKAGLEENHLHHGKEATVVAIAPVANLTHYYPIPFSLTATCKAETGERLADWLEEALLDTYFTHDEGRKRHGELFSVASDGASCFRSARFHLFMRCCLDPTSDLGRLLYPLDGLNCYTGKYQVLGTCDFKHVIKRCATLARSSIGIKVGNVTIIPDHIETELRHFMTLEKAKALLDPADKQNVPKAVHLIECLLKLEGLPEPQEPNVFNRRKAILFTVKTIYHFIQPFTSVRMSISDQVRSLSTYAHITAAMYHQYGATFLTGALYADSQAIVKNIIFTIGRLQLMNSKYQYFMPHDGTDRLENLFSHLRTQDHSRNFDFQQLEQKISIATEINRIFEDNPDIDQGHRRRDLADAEGLDRVNPKSWQGDLAVSTVDLLSEWLNGRRQANVMLKEQLQLTVDFAHIFRRSADVPYDFLRPKGEYVGTSFSPQDLILESIMHPEESSITTEVTDDTLHDDDLEETMESTDGHIDVEGLVDPSTSDTKPSHYIEIDGQKFYKSSIITSYLSGKNTSKTVIRPLRAQGVSAAAAISRNSTYNGAADVRDPSSVIEVGDLVVSLVYSGDFLVAAIIEVIGFEIGGKRCPSYRVDDLSKKDAEKLKIRGQPIVIQQRSNNGNVEADKKAWIWTHTYVSYHSKKKTKKAQQDSSIPDLRPEKLEVAIRGDCALPVARHTTRLVLPTSDEKQVITWEFDNDHLCEVMSQASDELVASAGAMDKDTGLSRFPELVDCEDLPYRDLEGESIVVPQSKIGPSQVTGNACFVIEGQSAKGSVKKLRATDKVECKVCAEPNIRLSEMHHWRQRSAKIRAAGVVLTVAGPD
ncbi:hypothetical protein H0H93_006478 [Arthromyces matolae]|nr:hypothetical protein H0H93_006478 [Arthromyces matolae]